MDLSIVIVTWNSEKEIGPCLRSVFSHSEGLATETIVIDNHSSDNTKNVLAEFKNIKIISNQKNLGFAAAVNQGIAEAKGDFVLLLNPDSAIKSDSLNKMVAYLRSHRDVGVAGGKVTNFDGTIQPSVRRFPTVLDQAIILTKLHNFFPKIVSKYFCNEFDYNLEQEVDQVRGAYYFVSRDLINKIGMLDAKNFFIWFEEVDYCRRAKNAGYKVAYVPSSVALHEGGASFGQALSLKKQRWLNASMRNYFRKHGTALDVLVLSLLSPVSLLLAFIVQKLKIKPKKYV